MRFPFLLMAVLLVGGSGLILAVHGGGSSEWGAIGVCLVSIAFAAAIVVPRLKRIYRKALPDFLDVFLLFQILSKALTILAVDMGTAVGAPTAARSASQMALSSASFLKAALRSKGRSASRWAYLSTSMRQNVVFGDTQSMSRLYPASRRP